MKNLKTCKCCGLAECKDVITIDGSGICNICNEYKNMTLDKGSTGFDSLPSNKKKDILYKKIDKHVKKCKNSKYNCVVAVSGGKDSLMTLYVAKNKLGLNPIGFFIDNGFALDEMRENIDNASKILGIDIVTYKTDMIKEIFRILLKSKKPIYYCRVCHLLIDLYVKSFCKDNEITLLLGGYTKGQTYINKKELFWIYDISDENTLKVLSEFEQYEQLSNMIKNPLAYFAKNFRDIEQISPFKYMDYNEDEIIEFLKKSINFKVPKHSWPRNSTNCEFNYLSQYLARKQFGYSQHETEMATLVRENEMSIENAKKILSTPITNRDIENILEKLNITKADICI